MITGEKNREYRVSSHWIKSRLIDSKTGKDKPITHVKFTFGYGKDQPYFICRYHGYERSKKNYKVFYSTGLTVNVRKGMFRIIIGTIIEKSNTNQSKLF